MSAKSTANVALLLKSFLPYQDTSSNSHDGVADRTTSHHFELQLSQLSLYLLHGVVFTLFAWRVYKIGDMTFNVPHLHRPESGCLFASDRS